MSTADDGRESLTEVRCQLCAHRHYAAPEKIVLWVGRPCLRMRCTGIYGVSRIPETNFYRSLYRSGKIRRVVAAEHTGLLSSRQREEIEAGFKSGGSPDAPNVLAATPTLEMGIDIGDLSAVMLTAVPRSQSNYVQRVGRAGRKTGNSFVTTFAEADPRSLYFLHDPELMISGDITPPSCYLDAIEILRRQYLAFLLDQAAQGAAGLIPGAGAMPRTIGQLSSSGLQAGGWMSVILEAGKSPEMVSRFVSALRPPSGRAGCRPTGVVGSVRHARLRRSSDRSVAGTDPDFVEPAGSTEGEEQGLRRSREPVA